MQTIRHAVNKQLVHVLKLSLLLLVRMPSKHCSLTLGLGRCTFKVSDSPCAILVFDLSSVHISYNTSFHLRQFYTTSY